jgi:hypothetical protein
VFFGEQGDFTIRNGGKSMEIVVNSGWDNEIHGPFAGVNQLQAWSAHLVQMGMDSHKHGTHDTGVNTFPGV